MHFTSDDKNSTLYNKGLIIQRLRKVILLLQRNFDERKAEVEDVGRDLFIPAGSLRDAMIMQSQHRKTLPLHLLNRTANSDVPPSGSCPISECSAGLQTYSEDINQIELSQVSSQSVRLRA